MMQEFVQEIKNTVSKNLKGVHTAMPGEILSYDPATGLATVQPKMKYKKPDGTTIDFPQVTGAGIAVLRDQAILYHKDVGLVSEVFTPQVLNKIPAAHLAIGHVRYSTTGATAKKTPSRCLIIVGEQSLDYWMYGQETSTDLSFDMTNAMCIPGLFAKANSVAGEAYNQNAIIVDVNGTRLTVKGGSVQVDAATITMNGNVTVNGNFTTQGGVVNLN